MQSIVKILSSVAKIASDDKSRPHLASVRVACVDGAVSFGATDGHTAILVRYPQGQDFRGERCYNAKQILTAAKVATKGYARVREDGALCFFPSVESTDATIVRPVDVHFPPLHQVFPASCPAKVLAWVNPAYVAEHMSAHLACLDSRCASVCVETGASELDPVRLASRDTHGVQCVSVIMPMRSEENGDAIRAEAFSAYTYVAPVAEAAE